MPTRYSRAGRLSSMPLRVCSQVKLVSHPSGATAIFSRSSLLFAAEGGVVVCAHAIATPPLSTAHLMLPACAAGSLPGLAGRAAGVSIGVRPLLTPSDNCATNELS